ALLKVPCGAFDRLASDRLPTGGCDVGLGGQASLVFHTESFEVGGAVGLMALLPYSAGGRDIDRGDPLWVRAWANARIGSGTRLGLAIVSFNRGADRVDHSEVSALERGGEPGAWAPSSMLFSIAPTLERRLSGDATMLLSVSDD